MEHPFNSSLIFESAKQVFILIRGKERTMFGYCRPRADEVYTGRVLDLTVNVEGVLGIALEDMLGKGEIRTKRGVADREGR